MSDVETPTSCISEPVGKRKLGGKNHEEDANSSLADFRKQLEQSKLRLGSLLESATERLATNAGGETREEWRTWLALQAADILSALSDAHHATARGALKLQAVSTHQQLTLARKAAQVEVANQGAKQLGDFQKQIEVQSNDTAEVERTLELTRKRLLTLKLKHAGTMMVTLALPSRQSHSPPRSHALYLCILTHATRGTPQCHPLVLLFQALEISQRKSNTLKTEVQQHMDETEEMRRQV